MLSMVGVGAVGGAPGVQMAVYCSAKTSQNNNTREVNSKRVSLPIRIYHQASERFLPGALCLRLRSFVNGCVRPRLLL